VGPALPQPGAAARDSVLRGPLVLGVLLFDVAGEPAFGVPDGSGCAMTTTSTDLTAGATIAGGTGEPMVTMSGVDKWFGSFQALSGIDLEVGKSEVVV